MLSEHAFHSSRYLTSKCLTFHFQKLDNTIRRLWFGEDHLKSLGNALWKISLSPELEVTVHVSLLYLSVLYVQDLAAWEDRCQELLSSPELWTVTHVSPMHPQTPITHENKSREKWLHTHVPPSYFPLNKNKLTAEPWDRFLVFTTYKNFIDP